MSEQEEPQQDQEQQQDQQQPSGDDPFADLAGLIKRQRDELKLKMHLAQADAKDEWTKLESKWKQVEQRAEPLTGAVKESAEAAGEHAKKVTGATLDVVMRELNDGYTKLRKLLD